MSRSNLRIAIIVLALITATIHLGIGLSEVVTGNISGFTVPFILNGIGFIALLFAMFANVPFFKDNRPLAHYLMMAFAAITIIGFFVVNRNELSYLFGPPALISKIAELLIIIATFLHLRAR